MESLNESTGEIYTVVEKRGPVVSHPGEWCCPCGYLDWDESLIEACQREVKEETGITLDKDKILHISAYDIIPMEASDILGLPNYDRWMVVRCFCSEHPL